MTIESQGSEASPSVGSGQRGRLQTVLVELLTAFGGVTENDWSQSSVRGGEVAPKKGDPPPLHQNV